MSCASARGVRSMIRSCRSSPLNEAFRSPVDGLTVSGMPYERTVVPLMLSSSKHERPLFQRAGRGVVLACLGGVMAVVAGCAARHAPCVPGEPCPARVDVVPLPDQGYQWRYLDGAGRLERTEHRAVPDASAPILSVTTFTYDQDRVVSRRFLDAAGNLVERDGVAITRYTYEPNAVRCVFYDRRDAPAARADTVAQIVLAHDGGTTTRATYADRVGRAVASAGGDYAAVELRYRQSRLCELRFLGPAGEPREVRFREVPTRLVRYEYLTGARNRTFVVEHALNQRGETTRSTAYAAAPFAPPLCECGVEASGRAIAGAECLPVRVGEGVTQDHRGY